MRFSLILALLLLAACDRAPWQGWIYPNKNDLTDDIAIGRFPTLEQCRSSATSLLKRQSTLADGEKIQGDYECGYKCKPAGGDNGLNICDKTER